MTSEEVITEAMHAMAEADGQILMGMDAPALDYMYGAQARAAFAVFEKAHAPADDEREAWVPNIYEGREYPAVRVNPVEPDPHQAPAPVQADRDALLDLIWGDADHIESVSTEEAADRIIAAGFHRTESEPDDSLASGNHAQSEPTDAQVDQMAGVLEHASMEWDFEFTEYRDGNRAYIDPGPKAEFLARAVLATGQGE